MRILSLLLLISLGLGACSSSKTVKTESDNAAAEVKESKLDGTWQADYIMQAPRNIDEIFPYGRPVITFNTAENRVNGKSGCNNFTGSFKTEGMKISWPYELAGTRKMCPEMAGEQLFLETLKKTNSYSVTQDGSTLNLIMGDIAVMRLQRQ